MTFEGSRPVRTVLVACDKFKGTLTSAEVAEALAAGLAPGVTVAGAAPGVGPRASGSGAEQGAPGSLASRRAADILPAVAVRALPIADGGDGSLDVVLEAGATAIDVPTEDAHGRPRIAAVAFDGTTATVEVARVCGLGADTPDEDAALSAGTAGVGRCIRAALDAGAARVVLGVGGTATSDGGSGMLRALGVRVLDAEGREVGPGGGGLASVDRVDASELDPRLADVEIVVATDVDNPLLGPEGAAAVYGPQKGATPAAVAVMAGGLERWARLATTAFARPGVEAVPGAGAGGGLGFAAVLLGGRIVPGAEYFLGIAGLGEAIRSADLVITGEGRLDGQTLRGKAPAVVARAAVAAAVPVVAVVGASLLDPDEGRGAGFRDVLALVDRDPRCATDPARSRAVLAEVGADLRRRLVEDRVS